MAKKKVKLRPSQQLMNRIAIMVLGNGADRGDLYQRCYKFRQPRTGSHRYGSMTGRQHTMRARMKRLKKYPAEAVSKIDRKVNWEDVFLGYGRISRYQRARKMSERFGR